MLAITTDKEPGRRRGWAFPNDYTTFSDICGSGLGMKKFISCERQEAGEDQENIFR